MSDYDPTFTSRWIPISLTTLKSDNFHSYPPAGDKQIKVGQQQRFGPQDNAQINFYINVKVV